MKLTADHIIAATKNAKANLQAIKSGAPLRDVATPTPVANSLKDQIIKKTLTKSPAESMKDKILKKTQEKQISAPQAAVVSSQDQVHNIIQSIKNKQ